MMNSVGLPFSRTPRNYHKSKLNMSMYVFITNTLFHRLVQSEYHSALCENYNYVRASDATCLAVSKNVCRRLYIMFVC